MIIRMDEIWIGKIGKLKCAQKFLCSHAEPRRARNQTMLTRAMLSPGWAIMMFCRCCYFCDSVACHRCLFSFFRSFFSIPVNYATICFAKISKNLYAIQLDNLSISISSSLSHAHCVCVCACERKHSIFWGKCCLLFSLCLMIFGASVFGVCLLSAYFISSKRRK